jgi:hypothetical protein
MYRSVPRVAVLAPVPNNRRAAGLFLGVDDHKPVIVIVGGGFGGLAAAKALKNAAASVVLIDRTNHHLFQPLLYQVATSVLTPGQIGSPIRAMLRKQANTTVLLGEVTGVHQANRCVLVSDADRANVPGPVRRSDSRDGRGPATSATMSSGSMPRRFQGLLRPNRVRLAVSQISRRRTDQLRDLMTVLELGAIDLNYGARIAQQALRCRFHDASLARARRSEEQKVSDRRAAWGQPVT